MEPETGRRTKIVVIQKPSGYINTHKEKDKERHTHTFIYIVRLRVREVEIDGWKSDRVVCIVGALKTTKI